MTVQDAERVSWDLYLAELARLPRSGDQTDLLTNSDQGLRVQHYRETWLACVRESVRHG